MIKKLLIYLVKKVRNENLEIGNFSNLDILRIFFYRFIKLTRGVTFLLIRFKKPKFFFLGNKSKLIGIEKMTFGKAITIGQNVKISSIGSKGFYFGNNFTIRDFSIIDSFGSIKKDSGKLVIGDNVGISEFCYFAIRGDIFIGDNVIFGPGVKIFTENHSFRLLDKFFRLQDEIRNKVIIGDNVWIGSNSIILPGVTIEDNAVIAAGSVVNKNIEAGTVVGGVPAKFIKYIK
jgi:acetyltransferase-like isoleucine patch superfamily enzyme